MGVVSGELAFRDAEGKDCGMGAYWRYETWIRNNESKGRGVPGSTGAITLLRREAFAPMPADTLLDDVFLPMHAMEQGWRCVFEPGAIAWDLPSASASRERVRKRRTLAGNLQLLFRNPRWILPGGHPLAFAFLHHKIMRLLVPFALIALFASNLVLAGHPIFQATLAGQILFYGLSLVGRIGLGGAAGRLAYLFWELNAAALLAWADALRGNYRVVWDRSDKLPNLGK